MIKTAIVFDHRGRAHGEEEGPVELRYTVNRKAYYMPTGVRLAAEDWFSGAYADSRDWPVLEKRIAIMRERLEEEINGFLERREEIEPKKLRERVAAASRVADSSEPFIDWAIEVIGHYNVSHETQSHYATMIDRLREFGGITTWGDLTPEKIMEWDAWLRRLPKRISAFKAAKGVEAPRIKWSTVENYHKLMRNVIRTAIQYGRLQSSPYERLRGMIKKGRREDVEFLPPEDLAKIEACHPNTGSIMEVVRDLFLLQSYTGMAYSDLMAFDISRYSEHDGVWRTSQPRKKTGVNFVLQLLPQAVEILKKYRMTVPKLDRPRYNQLLKILGEILGIKRRLSSHVGRHTFGTMMLRQGVRLEHVQKMMGHKHITTTQIYAKVLNEDVYAEYDKVASGMQNDNDNQ